MGQAKIPPPSKIIIGLLYQSNVVRDKTLVLLKEHFGDIDFCSQPKNFEYTDYYEPELGSSLKRIFVSFKRLWGEDKLAALKLYTNKLEKHFSQKGKRRINIDPGFLSLGKLILATTKDQSQRIYLRDGIFAEVTLFFKEGSFRPLSWTYPDYRSKEYIDIFNSIRKIYLQQLKASSKSHGIIKNKIPKNRL